MYRCCFANCLLQLSHGHFHLPLSISRDGNNIRICDVDGCGCDRVCGRDGKDGVNVTAVAGEFEDSSSLMSSMTMQALSSSTSALTAT